MSETSSGSSHVVFRLGCGFWFIVFLVIKLTGTSLAAWSWWWVLLPMVPPLALIIQKLGLLS